MVKLVQYSKIRSGRAVWAGFHTFVCPITRLNRINKLDNSNRWLSDKFVFSIN